MATTLRRVLHKYGLKCHPRCKKPFVSVINRRYSKRCAKAKKREDWYKQKINELMAKLIEDNQQNEFKNRDFMEQLGGLEVERERERQSTKGPLTRTDL